MPTIDKVMLEKLKAWWKGDRPENQYMLYVNSRDRMLTNATIRRLMFELDEEATDDGYVAFYSAKNFNRNMREYYSHIAELYLQKTTDDESIEDIIERYPHTCGWITLIVENIEQLSGDKESNEMLDSLLSFAYTRANVILVGNGDYKEVLSGLGFQLRDAEDGTEAKGDEMTIEHYDQEEKPKLEHITYDNDEQQRDELCFYWDTMYEQIDEGFFDYLNFKNLFRETVEYLIPRVTKEHVRRKDLPVIEELDAIRLIKDKVFDGCDPWEYDAARQFAMGLHRAVVNTNEMNDDFSSGTLTIGITVKHQNIDHGGVHISGYTALPIKISADTADRKMDSLATKIHDCTYLGKTII